MALDTYSGLKDTIADYLDRDDLTDQIDDFIDLAEGRHKREIRFRGMITRATATLDARYIALPESYLEAVTLRILTDPVTVLQQVDLYEMNRRRLETTGKPSLFTVNEEFEFDRAPDESYTLETVYYKALTPLSDSDTSNALLQEAPGAYLYASLSAAAPFLVDDERVALWETMYTTVRDALMASDKRGRHIGPQITRVAGATP